MIVSAQKKTGKRMDDILLLSLFFFFCFPPPPLHKRMNIKIANIDNKVDT